MDNSPSQPKNHIPRGPKRQAGPPRPKQDAGFVPPAESLTFLPLGGMETVTQNMYLYMYKNEILIVDCGLGFPDETMLGVDLLIPDITQLLQLLSQGKKIVGMLITHGHEDHIGALPFILPQLPNFPIYATPLTAAFINEKLKEFRLPSQATTVEFNRRPIQLGSFSATFIRITHSIPDSSNIVIKTPVGAFYHGGDYKFDLTPADGKKADFLSIAKAGEEGIRCVLSDCLGAERPGFTQTENHIGGVFEQEMRNTRGKVIITTYSSNIARLNQAISAAERVGRKVCFVGRSLVKNKLIGQRMGYLLMQDGTEVPLEGLRKIDDSKLVLFVAGSQGQENSAMSRIANGEHREIRLTPDDIVLFSSDPIPGNEVMVTELIDSIAKTGAKALSADHSGKYHVSGHGSQGDIMLLMSLTKPEYLVPISGNYKHMVAYRDLAIALGHDKKSIFLLENGQELLFMKESVRLGKKYEIKNVYVDQLSGEEVDHFVMRDRERLAKEGLVIIMAEIRASDGQLAERPEILSRGLSPKEVKEIAPSLQNEIRKLLGTRKARVNNWVHIRKLITDTSSKHIFSKLRRQPLVLPMVIEV
jgi:ribonuclease J